MKQLKISIKNSVTRFIELYGCCPGPGPGPLNEYHISGSVPGFKLKQTTL